MSLLKALNKIVHAIAFLLIAALFDLPVTASIPFFFQSIDNLLREYSGEQTPFVIVSIPALEELHGIRYSALIIDLSSSITIAQSGEGEFSISNPEMFTLASVMDSMPEDSLYTAGDVASALQIIYSGMDTPEVLEILEKPNMGEGQASSVGEGWELYGWVDSGEDHKTFALIALSNEGTELGLILLSDDLCCEEKADLAMMLLWQEVLELD